jgi:putative ABC transport system permease protein
MRKIRAFILRLAAVIRRKHGEGEFMAEMQSHLQMHIDENLRAGMSLAEARRNALMKLGGVEQTRESYRQRRGLPFLETTMQDLRAGLRLLRTSPGFAVIVVLTLALGIGANAAIFSIVNAVLLNPLPYKQADRLAAVWTSNISKGYKIFPMSGGEFAEFRAGNSVFEEMAPSWDSLFTLTGTGDPEFLIGYQLSAEYFHVLGTTPQLGRTFLAEEDRPGAPGVAVLSDGLWRRKFHADAAIIGKSIVLDGKPYNVVGVMPPGYQYPPLTEIWTPPQLDTPFLTSYNLPALRVMARLKPGVSIKQAEAQLNAIESRIAQQHPNTDQGNTVKIVPLREQLAGDIRTPLLILLGAVGFVLLIACANVANLTLARAAGRQKEIAVRSALGASRWRLIRQFLTESIFLSLLGGVAGIALASLATRFLVTIFPNNIANLSIPLVKVIPIDARVFLFALLVALLTGVLFGLAPVFHFVRRDIAIGMKETNRGMTATRREQRFRSVLVTGEVALALMLLFGASLFLQSFRNLIGGKLGFDAERVVSAQLFLAGNRYPPNDPQKRLRLLNQILEKTKALPGVEVAGATNYLPLSGFWGVATFTAEGLPEPQPGKEPTADSRLATPDYFRTMGIHLLKGRAFSDDDHQGAPQVAIVNETLAHRVWGHDDPIGRRLNVGNTKEPSWWEIVGVVSDVKSFGLEEETHGDLYRPFAQIPFPLMAIVVRSSGRSANILAAVKQAIWSVDKDQPVFKIIGMDQMADESLALRRVSTVLLGAFSTLAVLLAALGIYGLMAFAVSQRTHEIGVRMTLGAEPGSVLSMVIKRGMKIASVGLAFGLLGSLLLSRVLNGLLYGVKSTDVLTLVSTSAALAGVALAACYVPARRATRVDPMVALHYE